MVGPSLLTGPPNTEGSSPTTSEEGAVEACIGLLIEKVHLDDLDLYVITFCCVSNISFTLIISIETY